MWSVEIDDLIQWIELPGKRIQYRLPGAPRQEGSLVVSWAALVGSAVAFDLQYGYSCVGDVLTRIGMRAGGEVLPAYDSHNVSASLSKDAWTLTFYASLSFVRRWHRFHTSRRTRGP